MEVNELIVAYEQAQAELAEAEERDDAMDKIGVADKRTIANLRAQLAEAQAEVEQQLRIRDMRENECPKCGDQTWLTVMKTGNILCDYCGYEYDGKTGGQNE